MDPGNIKAYYRGAKAALRLKEWDTAADVARRGLVVDPGAQELEEIMQDAIEHRARALEDQQEEEARRERRLAPLRRLADAINSRGLRFTRPQFSANEQHPYLDEDDVLHWPVLFMYPEVMQQDVVEDFSEDDTFDAHLDVMFGEGAPPLPWDMQGEYTRQNVELHYLSHAGQPVRGDQLVAALSGQWPEGMEDVRGPLRYGNEAAKWVSVPTSSTLKALLQRDDCVIPGVPVFWVVARGSTYRERFLSEEVPWS